MRQHVSNNLPADGVGINSSNPFIINPSLGAKKYPTIQLGNAILAIAKTYTDLQCPRCEDNNCIIFQSWANCTLRMQCTSCATPRSNGGYTGGTMGVTDLLPSINKLMESLENKLVSCPIRLANFDKSSQTSDNGVNRGKVQGMADTTYFEFFVQYGTGTQPIVNNGTSGSMEDIVFHKVPNKRNSKGVVVNHQGYATPNAKIQRKIITEINQNYSESEGEQVEDSFKTPQRKIASDNEQDNDDDSDSGGTTSESSYHSSGEDSYKRNSDSSAWRELRKLKQQFNAKNEELNRHRKITFVLTSKVDELGKKLATIQQDTEHQKLKTVTEHEEMLLNLKQKDKTIAELKLQVQTVTTEKNQALLQFNQRNLQANLMADELNEIKKDTKKQAQDTITKKNRKNYKKTGSSTR
jgi:hypothetical protein